MPVQKEIGLARFRCRHYTLTTIRIDEPCPGQGRPTMETCLFSTSIQKPRDLLRSRQRARQIASLLGFAADRQATLAALVFDQLRRRLRSGQPCTVGFFVADGCLRIDVAGRSISLPLPVSLAHPVE